jgi:hypothetical protein
MDFETPSRDRDRIEMDQGVLHRRRGGSSTRGTLVELDLGGLCPLHWSIGLGRARTPPLMIMTSSNLVDALGGKFGNIGTCGGLEKPKEG